VQGLQDGHPISVGPTERFIAISVHGPKRSTARRPLFDFIASFLEKTGYAGVFLLMLAENVFRPCSPR
jgi:hypothetical protein